MRKFKVGCAALALITASTATAATVYNNGGPNAVNGNETTAWVQAEDFSFAANTAITGAGVYLAGFNGLGSYDGNFQFSIFGDSGGNPGAQLLSGSVSPTISDSGTPWCCGGNAQLFEFAFGSTFNALAGQTYFLGIHASSNFDRDEIYWVSTLANGTLTGRESAGGTYDNWNNNSVEHAFFLTDGAAGVVPEPSAWALLIIGFAAVGGGLRRRTAARLTYA